MNLVKHRDWQSFENIGVNMVMAYIRCLSVLLILLTIPRNIAADELLIRHDDRHENGEITKSIESHEIGSAKPLNYSDDFHKGEKLFPEDTGMVLVGLVALGLVVTVFLIANHTLGSFKIPA